MLTHFADEMLGEQCKLSKKQYTEVESVFIKKARENLRVHPNAHEMAKLRSGKSTYCKMIVMSLLFCNLKSIDRSSLFHKLHYNFNISCSASDVFYTLCLGVCLLGLQEISRTTCKRKHSTLSDCTPPPHLVLKYLHHNLMLV